MNNKEKIDPISAVPGVERSADPVERGLYLRYPHNPLEGFGNGCILDLRVRLASNFLQNSPRYRANADGGMISPHDAAEDALELAGELMRQAEARGWIGALDESGELTPSLRAQAKRTASFATLQQLEQSKFAQNEMGRVVPMAPGVGGGRH